MIPVDSGRGWPESTGIMKQPVPAAPLLAVISELSASCCYQRL
jgi:hypothetical protein